MLVRMLASLLGLTVVLLPVARPAADETKPLTIELKAFTFPSENASLYGYDESQERLFLYTNGMVQAKVKVPTKGDYEILVKASGDEALNQGARFKLVVDGEPVGKETETAAGLPKDYKFSLSLKAGEHKLTIEFTNDAYKEGEYDRNLYVHAVSLKPVAK